MSAAANLKIVEAYADAWQRGDLAALVALYHDDFTLHYGGANRLSGTHAGKAAALTALAEVSRATGRRLIEIVDVMAGTARATIVARERFEARGEVADIERVLVYRLADGKLHACWVFDAEQALVDRFIGA
jgi:ketosteroid isomerase-like protein